MKSIEYSRLYFAQDWCQCCCSGMSFTKLYTHDGILHNAISTPLNLSKAYPMIDQCLCRLQYAHNMIYRLSSVTHGMQVIPKSAIMPPRSGACHESFPTVSCWSLRLWKLIFCHEILTGSRREMPKESVEKRKMKVERFHSTKAHPRIRPPRSRARILP